MASARIPTFASAMLLICLFCLIGVNARPASFSSAAVLPQSMAVNPTPGVMLPQSGDTPRTRLLLGATTESSSGAVRAEATPHTAQQTAQAGLRADIAQALSNSHTSDDNGGDRH